MVVPNALVENATRKKRLLGYFIHIDDNKRRANTEIYTSCECQFVSSSFLAALIHALDNVFYSEYAISKALEELLERSIDIEVYVSRHTLFSVMAKDRITKERRLQNDLCDTRESNRRVERK